MKIKKGDTVKILSGKDKGKQGEVVLALPNTAKVVVKGVNIITKFAKKRTNTDEGGIIKMEAPIHASNVQVINSENGKPARIGYQIKDGKKIRVFKGNTMTRKATKESKPKAEAKVEGKKPVAKKATGTKAKTVSKK